MILAGAWPKRSLFSEEILSDVLPKNYKPINIEYGVKEDPDAHMARFEGLILLYNID